MEIERKGLVYAGITALLWGFLAIALKVSLNELDPVSVTWFRFSVAFILMLVFLGFTDRTFVSIVKRPPKMLFVAAFFLGMNYLGFISGINRTSPVNAQVFIQVGPVGLALAGIFIFREKLNWKHFTGFAMLVSGLSIFYSEQLAGNGGNNDFYARGITHIILSGISWATFSILQKMLVQKHNPNHLNLLIYALCALAFLPFVDFRTLPLLDLVDWLILIFLGLNTLFSYAALALALKYAEANKVSVIITLNPIITFILMAVLDFVNVSWILPENFTLLSLLGAAVVFAGATIVVLSRRRNGK
jgi:drug/metabolite transporter (DMT)-like permease